MAKQYERRTPQNISRQIAKPRGLKQAQKEYAELRKVANKRIQRAHNDNMLKDYDLFPTAKELGADKVKFAKTYSMLTKFLTDKRSTAAGRAEISQKRAKKLTDLGYEGVTPDNSRLFDDFMENFRRKYEQETPQGKTLLMDSDFALEVFDLISERFTAKTNARSMSRMFNDYLRNQGREDLIKYL